MKNLLLLLLLAPISLFAQLRDSVYVKTDIYECVYSEVLEQPKWIKYTVLCPDGTAPRKGMDFYTESNIKTSDNAENLYYSIIIMILSLLYNLYYYYYLVNPKIIYLSYFLQGSVSNLNRFRPKFSIRL